MRRLLLAMLLTGCVDRALPGDAPWVADQVELTPCCEKHPGRANQVDIWVCKSAQCPELNAGTECTTLSNSQPTYCQVPLTDDCKMVYLEELQGAPFQTVYCF